MTQVLANDLSTFSETSSLVMVCDDHPTNTDLIAIMLERQGYRVAKFYDGREALTELEQGRIRPDLLLLDVMMPGISGFEVARKLRANTKLNYFPIVLLTGMQDEKSRAEGLDAGADEFLNKPINRSELMTRVRSLVRLKRAAEELRRKTDENRRLNDELRSKNAQMARELEALFVKKGAGV